ncbi:GHMP kinase [Lewinellaceae bacterium SD302]|nr:GHMP kinase [Lewinellaceae bacterium SD302]
MRFRANGKLLLTGEYFVLDGAKALAVPTRYGQVLEVNHHRGINGLYWSSHRHDGNIWLYAKLDPQSGGTLIELQKGEQAAAERLERIIRAGTELNHRVPKLLDARAVTTKLDFPNDWGLGSSSTLIWMLAKWWKVDPFQLLAKTFGGSGYDLACAGAEGAVEFWRDAEKTVHWKPFGIQAEWVNNTYFVHLNRKQNSREGIKRYRTKEMDYSIVAELNHLSESLREALLLRPTESQAGQVFQLENSTESAYQNARELLENHEQIVSQFIELPKVKDQYFADFAGTVKSLGAWGGDFVWALPDEPSKAKEYFRKKGFKTVLKWEEMVLKH